AFSSSRDGDWEIYVSNADGSGVTQLTSNTWSDYDPRWSPDGSTILFVSFRDHDAELYEMPASGGPAVDTTNNHTMDERAGAAWSPDGSRIVYSAHGNPPPELVPAIRADLLFASVFVWSALLAIATILILGFGPPLGAMTVVLAITVSLLALANGTFRFVPGAVAAGLTVDFVLVAIRPWRRSRARVVVAAFAPVAFFGFALLTVAVQGQIEWSSELALSALILAGVVGGLVGWLAT